MMTGLGRRFIDVGVLDVSGVRLAGLGHWAMAARTVPALHMRGHQRHCEQMQQNGKGRYPDRRTTRATHAGKLQQKRKAPGALSAGAVSLLGCLGFAAFGWLFLHSLAARLAC